MLRFLKESANKTSAASRSLSIFSNKGRPKLSIFGQGAVAAAKCGNSERLIKYLEINVLTVDDFERLGVFTLLHKNGHTSALAKITELCRESLAAVPYDSDGSDDSDNKTKTESSFNAALEVNKLLMAQYASSYGKEQKIGELACLYSPNEANAVYAAEAGHSDMLNYYLEQQLITKQDIARLNLATLAEVHGHTKLASHLKDLQQQAFISALQQR